MFLITAFVMRLVGGAGLLLFVCRLHVYETSVAVLVIIGIPVVACFDRPKEPGKGPQSESS